MYSPILLGPGKDTPQFLVEQLCGSHEQTSVSIPSHTMPTKEDRRTMASKMGNGACFLPLLIAHPADGHWVERSTKTKCQPAAGLSRYPFPILTDPVT